MKPATGKERKLFAKLSALAERGVNGERDAAIVKLAELKSKFDFDTPDDSCAKLFDGVFIRSYDSVRVHEFSPGEMSLASSVKWAIEQSCKIPCTFNGLELRAQATTETAARLATITRTIAGGFNELWKVFAAAPGITTADQPVFLRGIYDGLTDEKRESGGTLPARSYTLKRGKTKRRALGHVAGITPHPYAVAVELGRQMLRQVPLDEINRSVENTIKGEIEA